MRADACARRARALLATALPLVLALAPGAWACSGEDVVLGDGRPTLDAAAPVDAGAQPDATAQTDTGAQPDAAGGAPTFSEPVAIMDIAAEDASDDDPSLSADLTLLYFNSERAGGAGEEDIWSSSRDSPELPWQPPAPAAELNTESRETGIALAPDALTIWWSSDRAGGAGGLDVYTATRASRGDTWSPAQRVSELGSAGDDLISAVTDGERRVLLARRDDDEDDYDLFTAQRTERGQPWGEPLPLAELNSDEEESDAFLVAGGTELLFTRDGDLQLAIRAGGGAFAAPVPLDSLNSEDDDRDAWASEDFGYVVFSSDRSGVHLLYEASR
jgi:WD40-like Beta Propeller Repeat